ncbi:flavin reductase [Mollicutes bacterium LVI A0039]|nr:flavin reductase [Mollicutes bacterium LVI A0039]
MNYENVEIKKFYYGSTILLLGYQHPEYGYKFTTVSSSYTLDNQIILGLGADGDCFRQISKYKNFSVNIISKDNLDLVYAGADNPGADRFKISPRINYQIDQEYNVPLIEGVIAQFVCTMTEAFTLKTNNTFINVAADINKRLFKSTIVNEGTVECDKFNPMLFFADGYSEVIK